MDLIAGGGNIISLPITKIPSLFTTEAKVRQLEAELATAKDAQTKFHTQKTLDIALQALSDINLSTTYHDIGEEDLILPSEEMSKFEASKLKLATGVREEEELMRGMRRVGIKNKRKRGPKKVHGRVEKHKRCDPTKGPQEIRETQAKLDRAVHAAAALGVEGKGREAEEMFVPGVGVVMGRKTAPRLTSWGKKN